jgi:hypothetical protein
MSSRYRQPEVRGRVLKHDRERQRDERKAAKIENRKLRRAVRSMPKMVESRTNSPSR